MLARPFGIRNLNNKYISYQIYRKTITRPKDFHHLFQSVAVSSHLFLASTAPSLSRSSLPPSCYLFALIRFYHSPPLFVSPRRNVAVISQCSATPRPCRFAAGRWFATVRARVRASVRFDGGIGERRVRPMQM